MSNPSIHQPGTGTPNAAGPLNGVVSSNGGDLSSMFTTLLVAQIKNQDPLQPTDPSQFVSQLAQLSQVQSSQQLVQQGQAGNSTLNSLQMMALGAQVGSTVRAGVNQLRLGDQPVTLHVAPTSSSAGGTLVLTGADGVGHSIALGNLSPGDQAFQVDPKALGLAPGSYTVQVQDANKDALGVEAEATLTGVRLAGDGSVYAQLQGVGEVASSAITQLEGRRSTSAATASSPL